MLFRYVGPPDLRGAISPTRRRICSARDIRNWARQYGEGGDEITVTFIVNARGELWIADRRSEHVACAVGGPVTGAGEMTFVVENARVAVVAASNQSTGFCPPPTTWLVLARVGYHRFAASRRLHGALRFSALRQLWRD